jgi:hypothetical protein
MSNLARRSLQEQRDSLVRQLELGRQLISQKFQQHTPKDQQRPRSVTMRLLTAHPALTSGLLFALAALFRNSRWAKMLVKAASVAQIASSVAHVHFDGK